MAPRAAITREEVSEAVQRIPHLIPDNTFEQFLDQVYSAIEIYLDLDEPSMVAKELREINRICQKPNYTLLNVLENISTTTRDLLEGSNLLEGSKPLSDRRGYRLIRPSKEGRPSKDRLSVLVSFVAAAYVSATGESYRRHWDTDGDLPFHQILEVLFKALGIDAPTDEAIKRQRYARRRKIKK